MFTFYHTYNCYRYPLKFITNNRFLLYNIKKIEKKKKKSRKEKEKKKDISLLFIIYHLLVLEQFLLRLRHCKRLILHKKLLIFKIRDPLS